jgi:uncharacterized alpha-E superfamily protein
VTHRRRYRGYVRPAGVLELLLMDVDNPRSLAFALDELKVHLAAQPTSTGSTRPERLVAELAEQVRATEIGTLTAIGGAGRPNLEAFLSATVLALGRVGESVHELHFEAGPAPRALTTMTLTEVHA